MYTARRDPLDSLVDFAAQQVGRSPARLLITERRHGRRTQPAQRTQFASASCIMHHRSPEVGENRINKISHPPPHLFDCSHGGGGGRVWVNVTLPLLTNLSVRGCLKMGYVMSVIWSWKKTGIPRRVHSKAISVKSRNNSMCYEWMGTDGASSHADMGEV